MCVQGHNGNDLFHGRSRARSRMQPSESHQFFAYSLLVCTHIYIIRLWCIHFRLKLTERLTVGRLHRVAREAHRRDEHLSRGPKIRTAPRCRGIPVFISSCDRARDQCVFREPRKQAIFYRHESWQKSSLHIFIIRDPRITIFSAFLNAINVFRFQAYFFTLICPIAKGYAWILTVTSDGMSHSSSTN